MSENQTMTLPDGRSLSYTTFGTSVVANTPVLFYLHGFPGTHDEGLPVHRVASKRGMAVVGVTRPGFGDSTHQPDRTLSSFASDLLHVADHLGVQRFSVLGISGGGPYAMACLHVLPVERLASVAVVSSMWPTSFGMAGMMPQLRILHNLARWVPGLVGWVLGLELSAAAQDVERPERFDELMAKGFKRWPARDQEVIFGDDGKLFRVLSRSMRQAIKHGTQGVTCEASLFANAWDFELKDVSIDGRLMVWHGGRDANVPAAMADQAVKLMPGVAYGRFDEEAHLSLSMKYLDEILDALEGKLKAGHRGS